MVRFFMDQTLVFPFVYQFNLSFQLSFELLVEVPVQLHLELKLNLLDQNVNEQNMNYLECRGNQPYLTNGQTQNLLVCCKAIDFDKSSRACFDKIGLQAVAAFKAESYNTFIFLTISPLLIPTQGWACFCYTYSTV